MTKRALVVVATLITSCGKSQSELEAEERAQNSEAKAHINRAREERAAPEASAEPKLTPYQMAFDKLQQAKTLAAAVAICKPFMRDTVNDLAEGDALLGTWLELRPTFSAIQTNGPGVVTPKQVQKDPDDARGKLMIQTGKVVEIKAEKTLRGKAFVGLLLNEDGDIVHFLAFGDTGTIVAGTKVQYLGIATGTYAYKNTGGGETKAVKSLGIFVVDFASGKTLNGHK